MKTYIHSEDLVCVSSETGEVTEIVLTDGDVITHKEESEKVSLNGGRRFVKVYIESAEKLCRRLSPVSVVMCVEILPFIEAESGILKKGNGSFADLKYLEKKTGKSYATVKRGISELLKEGLLAKAYVKKKQALLANPYVFMSGQKANATLVRLFENSGWRTL